jgi:Bacterial SH3 domain
MKHIFSLLKMLSISAILFAQEETAEFYGTPLAQLPENHRTTVFGDKINIRAQPDKNAAVLDQLGMGDPVTVLSADTSSMTQNGWSANWHKISYTKGGATKEGYAWGGVLSPVTLRAGDVSFVYNVVKSASKKEKSDGFEYETSVQDIEIRALQNGRILAKHTVPLTMDPGYFTNAFAYDNLGLGQCKNILKLEFNYPACGYTAYEVWFLWDGAKFNQMPVLQSFADAGAVAETETYIFPNVEGGLPDAVLYRYELLQNNTENLEEYDRSEKQRKMIWDGKSFVKPKVETGGGR